MEKDKRLESALSKEEETTRQEDLENADPGSRAKGDVAPLGEAEPQRGTTDAPQEEERRDEIDPTTGEEVTPSEPPDLGTNTPPEPGANTLPGPGANIPPELSSPEASLPEPEGAVEISPEAGPDLPPVAVSFSRAEGADIRYTLDGSEPDEASPLYDPEKALPLPEGKTLKARAYMARGAEGSAGTRTETISDSQSTPDPGPDTPSIEQVGAVEISPEAGMHRLAVEVSLVCPTEGAAIHYTLDGNEPDEASPLYDPQKPLDLRKSGVVKARAYKEGYEPSGVSETEYEVLTPVWQEKEPEDRTDRVDHNTRKEDKNGGWKLAGASVRGKLHAHNALWREDSFDFGFVDGWTMVAVSDGAGSAPLSRVGARLACEHALAHLKECLAGFELTSKTKEELGKSEGPRLREFLAGAASAALEAIRREAGERSRRPEDLTGTLLVVVHRAWGGQHLVGAIQVGDGSVALLERGGDTTLLGEPDHGEHSSETRFLTTRGVEEAFMHRVRFTVKDHLRCVAVMSDGVSDDFFPEEKRIGELFIGEELPGMTDQDGRPVHGVLHTVTAAPDPAAALLEWLRYEKRSSSDDRTLVLFWDEDEG